MTTQINIKQYLHEVIANRAKARLTIDQFDTILNMANQIEKISQKGLLIVALSEELNKISNNNYRSIQKFMNDFIKGLRPQKPKKQPQDKQIIRRRKNKPADNTNIVRNVDDIAEQSLSNPSNLQAARIAQSVSSQEEQSQKISQNLSKKSQQLPQHISKNLQYANQLQKISQGIQFAGGISEEPFHNMEPIEQMSKASSSQSFGVVSNFSQKMALLKKQTQQKKTIKRGQVIMTKKKQPHGFFMDKSLKLQKTKATLNESFSTEQKSIKFQSSESFQLYYQNTMYYNETFDQFLIDIKQNSAVKLQNFLYSLKKLQDFGHIAVDGLFETDFTHYAGQLGDQAKNFTSQQYFEDNYNLGIQQMSIFHSQNENVTFSNVSQKLNQPASIVFLQMLIKMQKGEIIMSQENPDKFGEIKVKLVSAQ